MHDIEIQIDVPVPMRDGTVLRADIYRPATEGQYPVVLSRGPYNKNMLWESLVDSKTFVRSGYVVICQDTRGRFASDGDWMPWKHERDDGYDTVEWAASLPYSNGKVGMFGPSYLGSTQWSAAISGAPHLVTVVPTTTWSDPEDGLMFRGGATELGLNTAWSLGMALDQYPRTGLDPEDVIRISVKTLDDIDALAERTYWQLPSAAQPALVASGQPDIGVARAITDPATTDDSRVMNRYDDIGLPTLNFAGWYDVFLQGSLDNYVGMRAAGDIARLIVGPWDHHSMVFPILGGQVGAVNYGLGSQLPDGRTYSDIHRAWFDHWLKALPATRDHESGVLIFVMGTNVWREESEWPLSRAQETQLFLGEDLTLGWTAPDSESVPSEFVYDPADPVPTNGGATLTSSEYPAGPFDQREQEARDDVLVFTTPPLESDLEITGRVRASIFASTDAPVTDWVVRLCDVDASGISRNIVDGITRVRTEASRIDRVDIDLWSTSIVIPAGHCLRVQVTSSNFPRWDRNLNTGEPITEGTTMRSAQQRIFHDLDHPSHITLPIVSA